MVFDMHRPGLAMRWTTSLVVGALIAAALLVAGQSGTTDRTRPVASTTYLCTGYSGCVNAGYSDAGYGAVSGKMYWNMYSGHNCTNYAAYRVIKAGGPATRPWSGGGNASEWGLQMKSITDQVPSVGAIAWWGRYSNGSGSAGHVAYVERVVSSTEIVISEDSWGGTFHWRTITKSSGRWPTGFIHFADKQLKVTAAPAISGEAKVGTALRVDPGTWSPAATRTVQWLADGVAIAGATGGGFVPTSAELGKTISVRVTGRRANYETLAVTTKPTAAVERGDIATVAAPNLKGQPYVDQVLTASTGGWNPADADIQWRWYVDKVKLADETGPTLKLTPEYLGKKIEVFADARKAGFLTRSAIAPQAIGPVLRGKITSTAFRISGRPDVGETLKLVVGKANPADAEITHQWLRNGKPIAGATGTTYKLTSADPGAVISVRSTIAKDTWETLVDTQTATRRVTGEARVAIAVSGQRGKAVVKVKVSSPGVNPVKGTVRIGSGGQLKAVKLDADGVALVTLSPIRKGTWPVAVIYQGSTSVKAGRGDSSVVVK